MTEREKVDHYRDYIKGYISEKKLLELIPDADIESINKPKNKREVMDLWRNYHPDYNEQYEVACRIFLD